MVHRQYYLPQLTKPGQTTSKTDRQELEYLGGCFVIKIFSPSNYQFSYRHLRAIELLLSQIHYQAEEQLNETEIKAVITRITGKYPTYFS